MAWLITVWNSCQIWCVRVFHHVVLKYGHENADVTLQYSISFMSTRRPLRGHTWALMGPDSNKCSSQAKSLYKIAGVLNDTISYPPFLYEFNTRKYQWFGFVSHSSSILMWSKPKPLIFFVLHENKWGIKNLLFSRHEFI